MKKILGTLIGLFMIGSANAAIIASDSTAVTVAGQTYSSGQLNAGVGPLYDSITVNFTARGDYSAGFPDVENVTWAINGFDIFRAGNNLYTPLDPAGMLLSFSATTATSFNDTILDVVMEINPQLWFNQITLFDGFLEVSWANSSGVDLFTRASNVSWAINAEVPEPSTTALFALGLLGLVIARRRSRVQ